MAAKNRQRWRFTKWHEHCGECDRKLDSRDWYHRTYGTCDSTCYMYMVGMSWSDFY
ncbi:hypothetical protein LIS82_27905 (plasmid) [Cytobacillus solani]|uniref:hypothetical protein n=1 Tax=Cytobacillus solani TaxID=1637975 RepID=UPI00207AA1D9|nr:hypothetical protein [Cytobacillus solani]USK57800.1 hypothetical protein LIS82_27905 [Cytobacillus solani]